MKQDTPIALADLTKMSEDERELLVTRIRERRLAPVRAYEELSAAQALVRKEQLEEQWLKQMGMFAKELVRADAAMDKLVARGTKLRAIQLEVDDL
jgi:hypothetical protein|tara:strand:- start:196 stop:483 length:288 start_codon:yes stop_codon:yes gene_type:complete